MYFIETKTKCIRIGEKIIIKYYMANKKKFRLIIGVE